MGKKLEEDPVEDASDEPGECSEEEPSEELEEDPEEDPGEELEEDSEEVPTEQEEEDPEEEPSEELVEEQTCEPSECVSLSHSDHYDDETQDQFEDPSEASVSEPSSASDVDEAEYQSVSVPNNSNEKKRSLDATTGNSAALRMRGNQSRNKCRQLESSNFESELRSVVPDLKGQSGLSMAFTDNCATKEHEGTGSSGKQRRSRWDPLPEGDWKTGEDERTSKKRKSRWASDESQLKMLDPIQLPDFMKGCVTAFNMDPQVQKLKAKLYKINSKLRRPELRDGRPNEEKSPYPEPVYNNLGIRLNTRDVRLHQKLIQQRQHIISKLIQKFPTFKPPSDDKPTKLVKKLYIPVKEYPGYNFIGLVIGPQGNTQKKMEMETGAKILLRGQGSSIRSQKHNPEDEDDDLHVRIETDNQKSLDAAVEMVEKLLIPVDEGINEHKRAQLEELAKLNGKHRDANMCPVCGEKGHQRYACPCLQSTFNITISCDTCGSDRHPTATCPLTALSPHSNSLHGSSSGLGLTPKTKKKPNKEINVANLFVGYLPQVVDGNRLKELFSPFGKLIEAKVIKDRTTGLSKGYGFVKFENVIDAAAAVTHMNGYKMDGKMLAVRVAGHQPITGCSVLNHLPMYPSPAAVSQNVLHPTAWPGPPGSYLPEPQASLPQLEDTSLLSTSIYAGNGCLLPKSDAFVFTPPSGISSFSNLNSGSSLHSFYNFPNQIPFSSPISSVQFPGDPDYHSSQFQSCPKQL